MLTEEALILLATLGASALLVLGIVELAWPSAPRRRVRPPRVAPPARVAPVPPETASRAVAEEAPAIAEDLAPPPAAFADAAVREESVAEVEAARVTDDPAPVEAAEVPAPVVEPAMPRRQGPRAPRAPRASELRRRTTASPEPEVAPPTEPPSTDASVPAPPARDAMVEGESVRPRVLPVDTCLAMYEDRRFAEVVSLGSAALEVHARLAAVSDRPDEASALLDLVGLAKHELGDRAGARAAFRAAIRDADAAACPTYVDHLVTAVLRAVDGAREEDVDTEQVRELRDCAAGLDAALAVMPGHEAAAAAQAAVRDALLPACERLVARVVAGEADEQARALVFDALADEAIPAPWRERLREQLSAASSAEIGQLTAHAIRSVQDGKDAEALESLERAERLAATLPAGAVADERREELDRRLWWGYTKVGFRRVEVTNFEGALEPLFRALHLGGIDDERLAETRAALVRALEGVIETRTPAIAQLAARHPAGAHVEIEALSGLVQSAAERGLPAEDVAEALDRVARLRDALPPAR